MPDPIRSGALTNPKRSHHDEENVRGSEIEASERVLKELRKAITQVFGAGHPVQRCRNHKLRIVHGHLPKDQQPQVKAPIRAAWRLDAKDGMQKLEQLARWLERAHPSAAASPREGLQEMFTINRLGLPPRLRKCLALRMSSIARTQA